MQLDSTPLKTMPGTAVKVTLQGLRLPISGLEVLAGQRENDSWPPTIAFESFEAGAKQVVGSIIHDHDLVDEGRVQQAKVAELRHAVDLEVEAEQTRAEADSKVRREHDEAAEKRRQAEERTRQEKRAIERDRTAAKQQAKREVENEAEAVNRSLEKREQRNTTAARRSRRAQVDQEAAALQKRSKAVKATKVAKARADELDQQKRRRQAN